MRKYILVALVLVLLGIGASFLLIPSASDMAVMQAKDIQTVDLGNIDVEAEYAQGRRSFPIIKALVEKRINTEGNRPAAVKLLEEYLATTPNDPEAMKLLAEQYMLSGRTEDYNLQIKKLAEADPTEETLKTLSYIYNAAGDYTKQAEALAKLVEITKGENPQYFADLATIQMVAGHEDEALATIQALKTKHPEFSSYAVARIEIAVLAKKGQGAEALAAAEVWATAHPDLEQIADLVNVLHYNGLPEQALALATPRLARLNERDDFAAAYVNASITAGRSEDAYQALTKLAATTPLKPGLYEIFLRLTLERADMTAAEVIAKQLAPAGYDEKQALSLLGMVQAAQAPTVLTILATAFNTPALLSDKPVLAAVTGIILNAPDAEARITTALSQNLTSPQRGALAAACARAGKTACFDTIIALYPPRDEMDLPQLTEFAQLFILANRAGDIVDAVGAIAAKRQQETVFAIHRRLAAAAGRADILTLWLDANRDTVSNEVLLDYFFLANANRYGAVAAPVAEILYARSATPANRDLLISAYLNNQQPAKALPLLREQAMQQGANDALYLATLGTLARKDPAAQKELTTYAEAALKAVRGTNDQQLNYAYILLNNGQRDVALPIVREYAKSRGGEWQKILTQITLTPGSGAGLSAKTMTVAELVKMADRPGASEATRRSIGFELIKRGAKQEAMPIFQSIADKHGPESQQVKDLLYLWGGTLTDEQIAWVSNRAKNAQGLDRQKWGELIANYGDDRAILQYVSTTPDALYQPQLRQQYFRVLASRGGKKAYSENMRPWVAATTDIPALLDYAKTAQGNGYLEAAQAGFERILALNPNQEYALGQMGIITFAQGNLPASRQYLDRYVAQIGGDISRPESAQVFYYRAQLNKLQGRPVDATRDFDKVVASAGQTPPTSREARSRLYTSMMYVGQQPQAMQGFEALLQQYPNDKNLLADYMSVLVEFKLFADATRIANQYDKNSPYYGRQSAVTGQGDKISRIERVNGGRAIKISFAEPLEGKTPLKNTDAKWVESTKLGYDTVTIAAKPGYVVRFVPTAATGEYAVVPAPTQQLSPEQELELQQNLRLQMLYAQIEQETGQKQQARERMTTLRQTYPQDPALVTYAASLESSGGNQLRALQMLEDAQSSQPNNQEINNMLSALRKQQPQDFVALDFLYRSSGDSNEYITGLQGRVRGSDRTEYGMNLQTNEVDAQNIVSGYTGIIGDYSASRQQGELYGAYYFDEGGRAQLSGFANNWTAGAGAYYGFGHDYGRTQLIGEYRRPYWDYVEAVYSEATRSRVGVKHAAIINPTLSMSLEGSLNQYSTEAETDAADTGLIRANFVQQLQPKVPYKEPYIGLGIGFDGEYEMGSLPTLTNALGQTYNPLPQTQRSIFLLSGIFQHDFNPKTRGQLVAGYAYDAEGSTGSPNVDGRLGYDLTEDWTVEGRASYGFDQSDVSSDVTQFGVNLRHDF
jgi:tetratricopeptide (TPR) repeat protein